MIYLIQFLFYLTYFFLKIYSLLDKFLLFSASGTKLSKYIQIDNLKSMSCNLRRHDNIFYSLKDFFLKVNLSPYWYKQVCITLLVSASIVFLKISLTYEFIKSNFLYINIFSKNIDVSYILGEKFIYFKLLYYILFIFLVINITYKLVKNKIYMKKEEKIEKLENLENIKISIGQYDGKKIYIDQKGIFQNLLITGSIGSGKTSGAISNILDDLIESNLSGLIIDVKGNYIDTVKEIARKYNREETIKEISLTSKYIYNPLDKPNISCLEIANRLKQVLILTSKQNLSDSFWLDKAESYIRDLLTLIRAYKEYVDFGELHKLVINEEYLNEILEKVKNNILSNKFSNSQLFELNNAIVNIKDEYLKLDQRTISIIRSEITRITNIFVCNNEIYNKFCKKGDDINLLDNGIFVLSINIGENKLLSKIISTYLKLDFQKQVLSSNVNSKPNFFLCDEYQEIANLDDSRFFSLSREYKCINILSMQSYSSLIEVLQNEYASRVIIQNLVNKIWFRNDDVYTISEAIKQIGKDVIEDKNISYSEGGSNDKYSHILKRFKSYKSSLTKSYTLIQKLDYKFNEKYFSRILNTFEAVCLISNGEEMKLYENVKFKRWGCIDEDKKE